MLDVYGCLDDANWLYKKKSETKQSCKYYVVPTEYLYIYIVYVWGCWTAKAINGRANVKLSSSDNTPVNNEN
jgi:hypothetical protein